MTLTVTDDRSATEHGDRHGRRSSVDGARCAGVGLVSRTVQVASAPRTRRSLDSRRPGRGHPRRSGGLGAIRITAGGSSGAYLNGVSSDDTDLQLTLSTDKDLTGGGLYAYVIGRRVLGAGDYLAKVRSRATEP